MYGKKLIGVILILLLAITFGAIGCGDDKTTEDGATEEKTIVFANEAPFSGPYAAWGLMAQPSLELAAEDINADGGIKVGDETYKVKIEKYDNGMDPTVAATVTRQAIDDDDVKYISLISTDEAAAVNELCNEKKVCMFAMAPARELIGPEHPYSFQTYYEIREAEEVILEYSSQTWPDKKRVAVIAPDDTRGHIAGEDFKEVASAAGFELVDVLYTGAEQADFYSMLTPLLEKGVDIINVSASSPEVQGNVIKQARELGYQGMFMHPDTLDVLTVSEISGIENLEGNLAGSQWVEMPTQVGKDWEKRYVESYGSLQGWTGALYDNVMLLKLAMEKADSIDPEKVTDALGEVSYEGVMGTAAFRGADIPSIGRNCALTFKINVVQVQNGAEVDVYNGYGSYWKDIEKETQ